MFSSPANCADGGSSACPLSPSRTCGTVAAVSGVTRATRASSQPSAAVCALSQTSTLSPTRAGKPALATAISAVARVI